MPFSKDIVADYGAVGDGVTNDRAAFLTFRDAAAGLDATLTSPSGKTYYIGPRASLFNSDEDYLFSGIPTFQLDFNGSSITDAGSSNEFHLGARHVFYSDQLLGARIETVAAGASTVTLKTSTDHLRFTVGDLALMAGYQMQDSGFPANAHFFEFVRVLSKQTTSLPYTITFTSALRNGYKSTWPDWGANASFDYGPAILYRLDQGMDCVHEYRELVVDKTGATRKPTNCQGRIITLRDVTPTNQDGLNPTTCVEHNLIDCNYTAVTVEVDKFIETLSFSGCSMNDIAIQSSSVDLLTVSNTTFAGAIVGLPKRAIIDTSTLTTLVPGVSGYGACSELTATNSVISDITIGSWLYDGGNNSIGDQIGVNNGLNSMTSGVITIPKSYTAKSVSWAAPGTWCCWQDKNRACIGLFQVIDVTDDATHVYIHTSETGTWPSYDSSGGGILSIRAHPAPRCTFTNCSATAPAGTDDGSLVYGLTRATAGVPLWSFARRVFDGETAPNSESDFGSYIWGNLVSAKMTVSPAYSGAVNPAKMVPLSAGNWTTKADGSISSYNPEINIRTGGERKVEIISGSETPSGFVAGDASYTLPEVPSWFANKFSATMEHDIRGDSGTFAMTVEITTDQDIVADQANRTFHCRFV